MYMPNSYARHDSFIRVTWPIYMCDMTHSCMRRSSFLRVNRIHMCDVTHWYVWHDSFVCVTWLIHVCGLAHSYVWIAFIRMNCINITHNNFVFACVFACVLQCVFVRVAECCSVLQCACVCVCVCTSSRLHTTTFPNLALTIEGTCNIWKPRTS